MNNLVKTFERNRKKGNKLLQGGFVIDERNNARVWYEDGLVFSDITWHKYDKDAKDYYKQLDADYPNSKFILNTRDADRWIESRKRHGNGKILKQSMKFHKYKKKEIEKKWKNMFFQYHKEVNEYFKNREKDLLIFDIDSDDCKKIINFFEGIYDLDKKHFKIYK
jgi:hypothetical protein